MSIVLSSDEAYLPFACLSILSLVESAQKSPPHTNGQSAPPLDIWLLLNAVSKDAEDSARLFLSQLEATIHFQTMETKWCEPWASRRFQSPAKFARLMVDKVVKPTGKTILYLDADTRIVEDIRQLYAIDLSSYPVGAVDDIGVLADNQRELLCRKLRIAPNTRYFNSGVMIIDLDRWVTEKIGEKAADVFVEKPEILTFNDQDALNCVLEGRWHRLPVKWNKLIGSTPQAWPGAVYHFAGEWKPWRLGFFSVFSMMRKLAGGDEQVRFYANMLKNSPWKISPKKHILNTLRNTAVLAFWHTTGLMKKYKKRESSPYLQAYKQQNPELFEA